MQVNDQNEEVAAAVRQQKRDGPVYAKYQVRRSDNAEADPASKHHGGCDLFVLDLSHDPAAIRAIDAYVEAIQASRPLLAADLTAKYLKPVEPRSGSSAEPLG